MDNNEFSKKTILDISGGINVLFSKILLFLNI